LSGIAEHGVSMRLLQLQCKARLLDLGHNKLTYQPEALGDLEGLTDTLYLHDNRLATLPQSLQRLVTPRYLNRNENAFEALPEAVSHMQSLIELRVTDNRQGQGNEIACLLPLPYGRTWASTLCPSVDTLA
jgi:hypothetical protein